MTYFIKNLPVEEEIHLQNPYIVEGDDRVFHAFHYTKNHPDGTSEERLSYELHGEKKVQKLKPFLCSHDVKVGDTVLYNLKEHVVIHEEESGSGWVFINPDPGPSIDPKELIKVIGEVSPKAWWVKDGDEYIAEDIGWYDDSGSDKIYPLIVLLESEEKLPTGVYAFPCPTCNTFH